MRRAAHLTRAHGFGLLEMIVVLALGLVVVGAILTLFDHSSRVARAQTFVADMQDSLRKGHDEMIRMIRMAGRGGLPLGVLPHGIALAVENDTPDSGDRAHIAVGDTGSPTVMAGTDVLIVRGVIKTPVYQASPLGPDFSLDDPETPSTGTIRLFDPHPVSGIPQDLALLVQAFDADTHPALLLVSPLDTWAVVEVDIAASDFSGMPNQLTLAFRIGRTDGTDVAADYVKLSGGFPADLRVVSAVGLLEEYRFYVRQEFERDGDGESMVVPRLGELRFYPNTQLPHPSNSDFEAEIADNIMDLQFVLGVDRDGDGAVEEGENDDALDEDEWLFNIAGDVDSSGEPGVPAIWNPAAAALHYLRVDTVARTDRGDFGYQADELTRTEDRDFTQAPSDRFNDVAERRFRRRQLQTVVDMRNL